MKTQRYLIAIIVLFLSVSFSYSQTTYTFNDGMSAAKSSGKKIFISIYSASDNWSKKMDSEVYTSPNVQASLSDFVFIKLNADGKEKYNFNNKEYTSASLAKFFGGTGYPTFVAMNPDGSIIKFKYNKEDVSNVSGFIGASDFIEMLKYFSSGQYKTVDLSSIFQN